MEVSNQESMLLKQFVDRMDQVSAQTDQDEQGDEPALTAFQEFLRDKEYAGFADTLTTLTAYYVENFSLMILVIPDKKVSDRIVLSLFFNTIDEVELERRNQLLLQLSVHRYLLFEAVANKASILEQSLAYIDELLIEPGSA